MEYLTAQMINLVLTDDIKKFPVQLQTYLIIKSGALIQGTNQGI